MNKNGSIETGLTERSKKFYDGTYKWDELGFTDENGVYREWGISSQSAPPTPKPPSFSSDILDDEIAADNNGLTGAFDDGNGATNPSTPGPSGQPSQTPFLHRDSPRAGNSALPILRGRLEGLLIGLSYAQDGATLETAYRQAGAAYPDAIVDAAFGHSMNLSTRIGSSRHNTPDDPARRLITEELRPQYLALQQAMNRSGPPRLGDPEGQREPRQQQESVETQQSAAGTAECVLFTPMSASTALSEARSNISEPEEIAEKMRASRAVDDASMPDTVSGRAVDTELTSKRREDEARVVDSEKKHDNKGTMNKNNDDEIASLSGQDHKRTDIPIHPSIETDSVAVAKTATQVQHQEPVPRPSRSITLDEDYNAGLSPTPAPPESSGMAVAEPAAQPENQEPVCPVSMDIDEDYNERLPPTPAPQPVQEDAGDEDSGSDYAAKRATPKKGKAKAKGKGKAKGKATKGQTPKAPPKKKTPAASRKKSTASAQNGAPVNPEHIPLRRSLRFMK